MSRHSVPTRGSGAEIALKALHALEGQAPIGKWQAKVGLAIRPVQWDVSVQVLISTGMIFQRGDLFIVSDEGLVYLGVAVEVVPRAEPEAAPARYTPPMRPLSDKHRVNLRAMREGAFDYRDIPSLHHGERVAFRTSLKVSGGDAQA